MDCLALVPGLSTVRHTPLGAEMNVKESNEIMAARLEIIKNYTPAEKLMHEELGKMPPDRLLKLKYIALEILARNKNNANNRPI